jgi:hypothetical protein
MALGVQRASGVRHLITRRVPTNFGDRQLVRLDTNRHLQNHRLHIGVRLAVDPPQVSTNLKTDRLDQGQYTAI